MVFLSLIPPKLGLNQFPTLSEGTLDQEGWFLAELIFPLGPEIWQNIFLKALSYILRTQLLLFLWDSSYRKNNTPALPPLHVGAELSLL